MSILPSTEKGYLPYFLLYTGTFALLHTVASYLRPNPALTQFSGRNAPPHHPLTAHIYGNKTFITGLVRLFAAYHIGNKEVYDLAIITFIGVLGLYGGEVFVFRTARMKECSIPFVTVFIGLTWLVGWRGYYVS